MSRGAVLRRERSSVGASSTTHAAAPPESHARDGECLADLITGFERAERRRAGEPPRSWAAEGEAV